MLRLSVYGKNGRSAQSVSKNPSVLFNTSQVQWKTASHQAVYYGERAVMMALEDLWSLHADDCIL